MRTACCTSIWDGLLALQRGAPRRGAKEGVAALTKLLPCIQKHCLQYMQGSFSTNENGDEYVTADMDNQLL